MQETHFSSQIETMSTIAVLCSILLPIETISNTSEQCHMGNARLRVLEVLTFHNAVRTARYRIQFFFWIQSQRSLRVSPARFIRVIVINPTST